MTIKVVVEVIGDVAEVKIDQEGVGFEVIRIENAKINHERVGCIEIYSIEGNTVINQ